MDGAGAWNGANIIGAGRGTGSIFCDCAFKLSGATGAKVIAGGDDIASMGVDCAFKVAEDGKHLGCVAARAKDNKQAGGGVSTSSLWRWEGIEGGKDMEESELHSRSD